MIPAKLEILLDLGPKPDDKIVQNVLNQLKSQDQVREALFKDGAVMVETTLPSTVVVDMVERTSGKRAVLQGFGEQQSAVAMVSNHSCCGGQVMGVVRFQQAENGPLLADGTIDGLTPGQHGIHVHASGDLSKVIVIWEGVIRAQVMGVVRFQQAENGPLLVDGTIDGLTPGQHGIHVHASGDLSKGCLSLGEHYNPHGAPHGGPEDPKDSRHAGDLGNICADETGRATFRLIDNCLQVSDIIGRSVAITERPDDLGRGSSPTSKIDGDSGSPVACGIIARSAGIFQNPKRICACDGIVVWDEKDRPLAGKGRRKPCCQKHEEKRDGITA
ncbi:copper/zinc superoxide dismutase (SODC) domain-containing protein [Phthorimaea operculella]|nr:copper/zinc superoxide dismutase (SODC) domain-containing protein [Phthorimaea operculella]